MTKPLSKPTVAILVANGVEEKQLTETQRALLSAGTKYKTVSLEPGLVNTWHGQGWGHHFPVDLNMGEFLAADYDMLVVPGGARSIAKLSGSPHTRRVLGAFVDAAKPVVLMSEAVNLLAECECAAGRKVAGMEASRETMEKAGAVWVDEGVVLDENILTGNAGEYLDGIKLLMVDLFSHSVMAEPEKQAA